MNDFKVSIFYTLLIHKLFQLADRFVPAGKLHYFTTKEVLLLSGKLLFIV